jgi:hypothetical protein
MTYTNDQIAKLSPDQIKALLNAAPASSAVGCKVGDKGNIIVFGLGRFPTSLYVSQWEKVIAFIPQLKAFIEANNARLARK